MKWIIIIFICSCYSSHETEIYYEGSNDLDTYSYDTLFCNYDGYDNEIEEPDFIEPEDEQFYSIFRLFQ